MGSILSTVTDDWLGLDPNGGGIYDVPVVGDIIDDQLGFDPGESPLQHILTAAGWIGAGYAGSQLYNHIASGGAVTDLLPNWASLSGADKAAVAADAGLSVGDIAASTASAASTAAPIVSAVIPEPVVAPAPEPTFLDTVGDTLGTVGSTLGSAADFADDVLGIDPSGGGIFDPVTGIANPGSALNVVTGGAAVDALGNALGYGDDASGVGGVGTWPGAVDLPSVDPVVARQQELADLQADILTGVARGDDAATNQLAQQAAQATGGAFGSAGTFGSQRHAQAAGNAAAQTILGRQLAATGQLPVAVSTAGVPYQTGVTGAQHQLGQALYNQYGPGALGLAGTGNTQQTGLLSDIQSIADYTTALDQLSQSFQQANTGGMVQEDKDYLDWF